MNIPLLPNPAPLLSMLLGTALLLVQPAAALAQAPDATNSDEPEINWDERVSPRTWEFYALKDLVHRYDCLKDAPDLCTGQKLRHVGWVDAGNPTPVRLRAIALGFAITQPKLRIHQGFKRFEIFCPVLRHQTTHLLA